ADFSFHAATCPYRKLIRLARCVYPRQSGSALKHIDFTGVEANENAATRLFLRNSLLAGFWRRDALGQDCAHSQRFFRRCLVVCNVARLGARNAATPFALDPPFERAR
ncbi:MAG: hypothetical protein AB7V61_07870, partial [Methylocystis sp.]